MKTEDDVKTIEEKQKKNQMFRKKIVSACHFGFFVKFVVCLICLDFCSLQTVFNKYIYKKEILVFCLKTYLEIYVCHVGD